MGKEPMSTVMKVFVTLGEGWRLAGSKCRGAFLLLQTVPDDPASGAIYLYDASCKSSTSSSRRSGRQPDHADSMSLWRSTTVSWTAHPRFSGRLWKNCDGVRVFAVRAASESSLNCERDFMKEWPGERVNGRAVLCTVRQRLALHIAVAQTRQRTGSILLPPKAGPRLSPRPFASI